MQNHAGHCRKPSIKLWKSARLIVEIGVLIVEHQALNCRQLMDIHGDMRCGKTWLRKELTDDQQLIL